MHQTLHYVLNRIFFTTNSLTDWHSGEICSRYKDTQPTSKSLYKSCCKAVPVDVVRHLFCMNLSGCLMCGVFFFFISAASDFKLNLRCCIYSKNSGIVTAQHYRLCSHQPTPFLSLLFSRSISLTPFSLSGCTSACRSGYLIHVQRHRFLIL